MKPRRCWAGPVWPAISAAVCAGMMGGGWAGLARVLPTRVFGAMSVALLLAGCIWFGRLGARLGREERKRNVLLEELLQNLASRDTAYEYQLVWGKDRRAQGPLELRRHRRNGTVEWRYDGSQWTAGEVPGQISSMFESGKVKKP